VAIYGDCSRAIPVDSENGTNKCRRAQRQRFIIVGAGAMLPYLLVSTAETRRNSAAFLHCLLCVYLLNLCVSLLHHIRPGIAYVGVVSEPSSHQASKQDTNFESINSNWIIDSRYEAQNKK
jgi:hypothetical protein